MRDDESTEPTVRFTMDVELPLYEEFKSACGPTPMTRVTRMLWENYLKAHRAREEGDAHGHVAAGHS